MSRDSVANIRDYRLRFSRGALRYRGQSKPLLRQEALDLAHAIHWCRLSSTPQQASHSEQVFGIRVEANGPVVRIEGFGRAISGAEVDTLIERLWRYGTKGAKL